MTTYYEKESTDVAYWESKTGRKATQAELAAWNTHTEYWTEADNDPYWSMCTRSRVMTFETWLSKQELADDLLLKQVKGEYAYEGYVRELREAGIEPSEQGRKVAREWLEAQVARAQAQLAQGMALIDSL